MILYLLKSASCLALLLFFYHYILEKEKMHNFNRFYLLGSILFSFLVPLATITIPSAPEIIEAIQNFNPTVLVENTTPTLIEESFNYRQLFIGIYLLIATILCIRFGRNLYKIIQKIRLNEKIKHQKATLILVEDEILPHTFWNYIFINKKNYKKGKIEEELFTHELTHVTQKHTLDVLLIEILQIVFWINPLFIFLKKAIQLNHEFLADERVINQHKNTFHYQHLLLNKAAWNNEYYLASNLNYSLTKKRLEMMTTQSSQTKIVLKKLAVIPLVIGFIFLFAERVEAQATIVEKTTKNTFTEYNALAKKHNKVPIEKCIINLKELNKLETLYKELSKEEKEIAQPFPECYLPNKEKNATALEKYKKLNKLYESNRNRKPHYIKSSQERQKELKKEFSLLGTLYFKLQKENKRKVKRPIHPQYPYIKIVRNNRIIYKLESELTEKDKLSIPPPPVPRNATKEQKEKAKKAYNNWKKRTGNIISPPQLPRNHLDQVIAMAKKGAKFYFEKEPIDSDKAIDLLKKNKKLSIHSESTNYGDYKVWISKTPIK